MEDLNELTKKLSKTEKRYIKRFLSLSSDKKDSSYIKLFDYIIHHPEATIQDLALSFKNEKWSKNISVLKIQLKQLILKALRNYHENSQPFLNALSLLQNAELLIEKNLLNAANKELIKAKKVIDNYEFNELLSFYDSIVLKFLNTKKDTENLKNEIRKIRQQASEHNDLHQKVIEAQINNLEFFNALFIKGKPRQKNEYDYFKMLMQQVPNAGNSFKINYIKNNLLSVFYGMTDDYKKSKNVLEQQLHLFNQHPSQLNQNINNYISILNNLAIVYEELNKHNEAKNTSNEIYNIAYTKKNINAEDKVFAIKTYIALEIYLSIKNHDYENIIQKIYTEIESYLDKVKQIGWYELYFLYNVAYSFYKTKDYHNTLLVLNKLFSYKVPKNVAEDIKSFSKILQAITFYQKNDLEELIYFINSTEYFLEKTKKYYKMEVMVIQILKEIIKGKNKKEVLFRNLKINLLKLKEDPFERQALGYFDFIEWCNENL